MNGYIKISLLYQERKKHKFRFRCLLAVLTVFIIITFVVPTLQALNPDRPKSREEILAKTVDKLENEARYLQRQLAHYRELSAALGENLAVMYNAYTEEIESLKRLLELINMDQGNSVVVDVNNLRVRSDATETQLNRLLYGSPMAGLGWEFLVAEREHEVNAIILIMIIRQESGLGRHNIRPYNAAGIRQGSGWRTFESFAECIMFLASLLDRQYLTEGGAFHNGLSLRDVNIRYCLTSEGLIDWGWSEAITVNVNSGLRMLAGEAG